MWKWVPPQRVVVEDGFWSPRREQLVSVTLDQQWQRLEAAHAVDNLRVAAGLAPPSETNRGPFFADSDVWKWLEAASATVGERPEATDLAGRVAEVVELCKRAQQDDGYLNSYHQTFAPDLRWRALLLNHELYCAGHLIEAACTHHDATGSDDLVDVATRLADLVVERFGPEDSGVPGHEEIEFALVRLARVTGDDRYLEQARRFVERRGRSTRYPRIWGPSLLATLRIGLRAMRARRKAARNSGTTRIAEAGGGNTTELGFDLAGPRVWPRILAQLWTGEYFQDAVPLGDLDSAVGHAVRAFYLLAAAACVAADTGDTALVATVRGIWQKTVDRRTYVTGGAGSLPLVEGFGRDWELPNRGYAETCSSIGSTRFSLALVGAEADSSCTAVADWAERTLHNGVLSGLALSGDAYFYQNPLVSYGEDQRQPWFGVACCPPNIARTLADLGGCIWTEDSAGMQLHMLVGSTARFTRPEGTVTVTVRTAMPWRGDVELTVGLDAPSARFALGLRVPHWAGAPKITCAGRAATDIGPGTYAVLERDWSDGDAVTMTFGIAPALARAAHQVTENRGRVAVVRGPLVYCAEGADNPDVDVHRAVVDAAAPLREQWQPALLGGVMTVTARTPRGQDLVLIPYYAWANRGPANMAVWLRSS